jgi:hypothetical protein
MPERFHDAGSSPESAPGSMQPGNIEARQPDLPKTGIMDGLHDALRSGSVMMNKMTMKKLLLSLS